MYMRVKAILASLVMCLAAAAVCFGADAFSGTWKLNEAKSKGGAGLGKNSTVTYETMGDSVKVTIEGTTADGKAFKDEWTGKYDGKDYPVTGNATTDSRSYKKIDDHTLEATAKKDGKVTITVKITVSADGKTRTVVGSQMDASGKKVMLNAVYDKQ
jgi:hypothetical protein